jgi:phospholipid-translocating ATPase
VRLAKGRRVPADMVLIWSSDPTGLSYIKTDQLDGEIDWKVRESIECTQGVIDASGRGEEIFNLNCSVKCGSPNENIYEFAGMFCKGDCEGTGKSLSLKNTLWANTTIAVGEVLGLVVYTGKDTRSGMNMKKPKTKIAKVDSSINTLSKFLFCFTIVLALSLQVIGHLQQLFLIKQVTWVKIFFDYANTKFWVKFIRYLVLLSYIIPISLRTNLDFAKIFYSIVISKDKE